MNGRSTVAVCLVAVAMLSSVVAPVLRARDEGYKVVVHPQNPVTAVARRFLRDAYLKKTLQWGRDVPVRPIALSPRFTVYGRFTRDILSRTPAQLKIYWTQRIFSGKGVPPPEMNSVAAAIAEVIAHRGAIAYLPPDADPGPTKVVQVR